MNIFSPQLVWYNADPPKVGGGNFVKFNKENAYVSTNSRLERG